MRIESVPEPGAADGPVRYGSSRLLFRGPRRPLDGRHVAFVGGSETYGRCVAEPFPRLVEAALGAPCVNFGQVNGSIDVAVGDPLLMQGCRDSLLCVVEVTGAVNMSNRFYQVHPRRNDRLTRVSTVMQALFPEVDFSEFCFTRHMLTRLAEAAPDRFGVLREELQSAWSARMRTFLEASGPNVILLWFSPRLPSDLVCEPGPGFLDRDPLFVTRRMLDALRPMVRGVVMVKPRDGVAEGGGGTTMTQGAHREAASALADTIRATLPARDAA